ncbi:unnamed protein product, partial [Pocillopora meandrina]
ANLSEVVFDLRGQTDFSERGKTFWKASELELKFSFEREWIKAVRRAKRRPNYGMEKMNSGLEEVCGNKLELCGPLVDGYLLEIGEQIASKLILFRGYSGEVKFHERKSKITSTLPCIQAVEKVFSPARFEGQDVLRKIHFSQQPKSKGKLSSVYKGRSAVVVSKNTPFVVEYNLKSQKAMVTFYIQRYTAEDFVFDKSLQSFMNKQGNIN